jgi:hypothetical protein
MTSSMVMMGVMVVGMVYFSSRTAKKYAAMGGENAEEYLKKYCSQ